MKAVASALLCLALCGCAHDPAKTADPNRYRNDAGVYHPQNGVAQRERWLNGAGTGVVGSGIGSQ